MFKTLALPEVYRPWWMFFAAFILGLLIQEFVLAQSPKHHLSNGNLPPGLASEIALRSNPSHLGHIQPVRIATPEQARVAYWTGNGYASVDAPGPVFGMTLGPVYRLKVTNIPNHPGKEVFPSIELLSRLHPPEGKQLEFPVPVVLTQDDLEQAIKGKMITKVVYLEDPETALPFQQVGDQQRNIDLSRYEDVLHTANRLGRPMAIIRVGSRLPLPQDRMGAFEFNGPALQILGTASPAPKADLMSRAAPPRLPLQVPAQPAGWVPTGNPLPPIVPGSHKASFEMDNK